MARTAWPTVLSGDSWSASQHNTYGRDNDLAYWVYTTAGDLAYATSSSTLARLAKPTTGNGVLQMSTAGAPSYVEAPSTDAYKVLRVAAAGGWEKAVSSGLHKIGYANGVSDQNFAGGWADITGASVTLALDVKCTIIVVGLAFGYNNTSNYGNRFVVRGVIDGTADADQNGIGMGTWPQSPVNQTLAYVWYKTGVLAGSRITKLQCTALGNPNYVTSFRMVALAFAEN